MKKILVYILKGKKLDCNKKTLDLSSVIWYNMRMRRVREARISVKTELRHPMNYCEINNA